MSGHSRMFSLLTALPHWWSLRLFPGRQCHPYKNAPPDRPLLAAAVLATVAGALFFTRLTCPLLEPEEARYAEIPRQMLAEGRLIEPVWHGQPYYHKPPLLYWLVMLSYRIFGVHDWTARLTPALASFCTVFVVWWWGRRALGPRTGFAAALMLALSVRFVYLGRMLTFDPLLTVWVTAALATAHVAVNDVRRRWWLASALLCGLGLLTKGPVALVLVLAPTLLFQWLDRRCARPTLRSYAAYLAVAIGIAGPWYAAMALLNPAAAVDFLWLHHVRRFLEPLDHQEPLWFFLPGLLLGTLPWSLLLLPVGRGLIRRSRVAAARRPPGLGFCLLALACCVGLFSLSGCKRAGYILPALPWLALCLGCALQETAAFRLRLPRARERAFGICAGVVFAIMLIGLQAWLPAYHRRFALRGQVRRLADVAEKAFCYPKRWDSVAFYLGRDDVAVFGAGQEAKLAAALQSQSSALLFVKTRHLQELREALPTSIEITVVGRPNGTLTTVMAHARSGG